MEPATISVVPKSPTARANARTSPATTPREASGSAILAKTKLSPAPRRRAASSTAGSIASNAPFTGSKKSGNDAKDAAITAPVTLKTSGTPSESANAPSGLLRPSATRRK